MIRSIKIGKTKFTFVFRHKWDKNTLDEIKYNTEYRLGLWFKKYKIVGAKNFNKPKEWGKNLVNDYMIGIDLIVCKLWVSFNRGGLRN